MTVSAMSATKTMMYTLTCLSMSAAWSLVSSAAWSLMYGHLQKIQDREEEDPDQIHEMPEEARVLDPVGEPCRVRLVELRARAPEIGVHRHPAQHMEHVQAGQGEIDGEKVVGAGIEMVFELRAVFEVLDHEEHEPEQDRQPHVEPIL